MLLSWSVSLLLWWRPYWFCLPLLSLHMLSLNLSTLLAPYAPPTPSSSDKIHPIKMHYEILHRVLHPCCTMTCGGGPVMMMMMIMMMVMVCVPCPNKTHNQHPPTHPLTFSPPPQKNIFHPLTFYYKWKQKSSPFLFLHIGICRIRLVCNLSLKNLLLHLHWLCTPSTHLLLLSHLLSHDQS